MFTDFRERKRGKRGPAASCTPPPVAGVRDPGIELATGPVHGTVLAPTARVKITLQLSDINQFLQKRSA